MSWRPFRAGILCISAGEGGGPITTLVKQAHNSNNGGASTTATMPADIVAGDLIFVWHRGLSFPSAVTATPPTGWTTLQAADTLSATYDRQCMFAKIADGSEASASIGPFSDHGLTGYYITIVFRPTVGEIASFSASGYQKTWTTGNPADVTITAPGTTPSISICINQSSSMGITNTDGTFTATGSNSELVGWNVWNVGDSPVNMVISGGDAGSDNFHTGISILLS